MSSIKVSKDFVCCNAIKNDFRKQKFMLYRSRNEPWINIRKRIQSAIGILNIQLDSRGIDTKHICEQMRFMHPLTFLDL